MSALLGQFWPYLAAIGVALATIIGAFFNGRKAGANAQKVKEAEARAKQLEAIKRAADAGIGIRPGDGGMLNDPHNRDR